MTTTIESVADRKLKAQLRKAENREKIAQCKLDRLKARFDKLYDDTAVHQDQFQQLQAEVEALKDQLVAEKTEKIRLEQEAAMWRAQLFERMEILDKTKAELQSANRDLEEAREKVTQAGRTQKTSHEELKRRDRERKDFERKIQELHSAHQETMDHTQEILSALTDAENAIESLQRSNDLHQREIVGLKAIGASLTEKLTQVTQQRDRYKERLNAGAAELRLEKAESEHLLGEVERLKNELYETRGKMLALQIQADVRETRRAGEDKSQKAHTEKYADFPSTESPVEEGARRSLLSRATKKMSGWFRLSDSVKMSRN